MRILLVNKYFYRKGGAETYFFALAEGLKALGHEVAFFSMRKTQTMSRVIGAAFRIRKGTTSARFPRSKK